MKRKLDQLKATGWVAHLLRAWTRFNNRLGNQFAAAITYFSVLALVPILMFAFSLLGMTVTTLRPELLGTLTQRLTQSLGSAGAGQQVADMVEEYLRNWRGVGLVGLASLLYAGSGWVANLRSAVQAQWRLEFEHQEDDRNIVIKTLTNMGVLILLLVGFLLTLALSIGGTAVRNLLVRWLGVDDWPAGHLLLRLAAFLLTVLAAWLLFLLLYSVLPQDHRVTRVKMIGSLAAAGIFALLQMLAGTLISVFRHNKAASLFGPVIVLMLFMNLFARIILLVACWIATEKQPAVAFSHHDCDEPLRRDPQAQTAEDHWRLADEDRATGKAAQRAAAGQRPPQDEQASPVTHTMSRPRVAERYRPKLVSLEEYPQPDPARMVAEPVAARSVKVGMASGWVVGAATGLGLGAALTTFLARLLRRR